MQAQQRVRSALRAAGIHFIFSIVVAVVCAAVVFWLWYPFPYRELSGGRELFLLVVAVDVVCGPLLTSVVYTPLKPKAELWRDLGFIVFIQLGALTYGVWTVWDARPLFLVLEVDRFKVIAAPALESDAVGSLPPDMRPKFWQGPAVVAIRRPKDLEEKNKVMFGVLSGGRDYAERPEFYIPYKDEAARGALNRAIPLSVFLQKFQEKSGEIELISKKSGIEIKDLNYLPVTGRQDWIAVLDGSANIVGFVKGDGF
ncbi:hypothetical protein PMI14_06516 [Acidovorax sp. CF316]|uniref:TfpX/TfpZ family type IV pilin accessory protein n=1 Tax=Acidovorax sp. CF316 TaxID=1144317 RepID=UPI00026BC41E|nr:TfpX/TfpZ family type IV pilin accessory protein [Acidovorax sp. CF316]EJE49063.1 hypothetical protein PMI14_06516 [Acidovorax sp. CF316]